MKTVSYQHVPKNPNFKIKNKFLIFKTKIKSTLRLRQKSGLRTFTKNIFPGAQGPQTPPPQGKIYVHTPVLHPKSTKYLYIFYLYPLYAHANKTNFNTQQRNYTQPTRSTHNRHYHMFRVVCQDRKRFAHVVFRKGCKLIN